MTKIIRTNKVSTKNTSVKRDKEQEEFKVTSKRILLVAGHQGRNLAENLMKQTSEEFSVQSMLKPTILAKILSTQQ